MRSGQIEKVKNKLAMDGFEPPTFRISPTMPQRTNQCATNSPVRKAIYSCFMAVIN